MIIVGGSMLCAATAASTAAATWHAGSREAAARQSAAEAFLASNATPAIGARESGQTPASAVEETEVIGFQDYQSTAARRAHALAAAAASSAAAVAEARAHVAHEAHLAEEARRAEAARQARDARQAAAAQQARQARQSQQSQQSQQAVSQQPASGQAVSQQSVSQQAGTVEASGSAQQIAQQMLAVGGEASQFSCLASLWDRESGWNVTAENPTTGAYGIPQSLPGAKMASAGPDWATNAATQIRWGLSYIDSLYGSPCGAWSHEEATGWY